MESHSTTELLPTSVDGSWTMSAAVRLASEDEDDQMAAFAAQAAAQALSENDDAVHHAAAAALGERINHDNDDVVEAAAQAAANGDVIASSSSDAVENHLFTGGSSIDDDADAVVAAINESEKIDFPLVVPPDNSSSKFGNDFLMPSTATVAAVVATKSSQNDSVQQLSLSQITAKESLQIQQQTQNFGNRPVSRPMEQERSSSLVTEEELVVSTICRICEQDDGRPLLRFLPVPHDLSAANAAPSVVTFTQDLCLHIFCGKTASILPTVNRPDLEILTKAGLKNKHGIGPEVNAALARTRCAVLINPSTDGGSQNKDNKRHLVKSSRPSALNAFPQANSSKEKQYYLVREFEAHLAAIRNTHISFASECTDIGVPVAASALPEAPSPPPPPPPPDPYPGDLLDVNMDYGHLTDQVPVPLPPAPPLPPPPSIIGAPGPGIKLLPIKAHTGQVSKLKRPRSTSSSLQESPRPLAVPHIASETLLLPAASSPPVSSAGASLLPISGEPQDPGEKKKSLVALPRRY